MPLTSGCGDRIPDEACEFPPEAAPSRPMACQHILGLISTQEVVWPSRGWRPATGAPRDKKSWRGQNSTLSRLANHGQGHEILHTGIDRIVNCNAFCENERRTKGELSREAPYYSKARKVKSYDRFGGRLGCGKLNLANQFVQPQKLEWWKTKRNNCATAWLAQRPGQLGSPRESYRLALWLCLHIVSSVLLLLMGVDNWHVTRDGRSTMLQRGGSVGHVLTGATYFGIDSDILMLSTSVWQRLGPRKRHV